MERLTIFHDALFGLAAVDEDGNRRPLYQRPDETTHAEMLADGKQRFMEAYPGRLIRWYRMDALPEEDLYVE